MLEKFHGRFVSGPDMAGHFHQDEYFFFFYTDGKTLKISFRDGLDDPELFLETCDFIFSSEGENEKFCLFLPALPEGSRYKKIDGIWKNQGKDALEFELFLKGYGWRRFAKRHQ